MPTFGTFLRCFQVYEDAIYSKGLIVISNMEHKFYYWCPSEHLLCYKNTKKGKLREDIAFENLGAFLPGQAVSTYYMPPPPTRKSWGSDLQKYVL